MKNTQDYLLRDIPMDVYRAARLRCIREGSTIRRVLLTALISYAISGEEPPDKAEP